MKEKGGGGTRTMNHKFYVSLDQGTRRLIDYQYGNCGGFVKSLFQCIERADINNLALLEKGFPEEVKAWKNYAYKEGWWGKIQEGLFTKEEG